MAQENLLATTVSVLVLLTSTNTKPKERRDSRGESEWSGE